MQPHATRRSFLAGSSLAAAAGAWRAGSMAGAPRATTLRAWESSTSLAPGVPGVDYAPVITPNGTTLPHRVVGGVKVFHLIAEDVLHEFAPGMQAHCWGYNGRVHGPTIEAVEGDLVRIYVTNRLPVPTTLHWHGLLIPNGMDGVGGLTQRPLQPGETFRYEFEVRQYGTYMYHSHHDEMTQMAMGMMGLFVIHPRHPNEPEPDRDYAILLSEWKLEPGTRRPDPNEMVDFNVLTFNAKIAPATQALVARTGERVRIRIGNLSAMDHHPIHLHGHSFLVTETDGGVIPAAGRWPEVSLLVPTGSTRTLEFVADNPGDWALHCHMTHHLMTQMGHDVPNLIGVEHSLFDEKIGAVVPEFTNVPGDMPRDVVSDTPTDQAGGDDSVPANSLPMISTRGPFGYVTMSGMFTVLKVRDQLSSTGEAEPYVHPPGTLADRASAEQMRADGIDA